MAIKNKASDTITEMLTKSVPMYSVSLSIPLILSSKMAPIVKHIITRDQLTITIHFSRFTRAVFLEIIS